MRERERRGRRWEREGGREVERGRDGEKEREREREGGREGDCVDADQLSSLRGCYRSGRMMPSRAAGQTC